ncbi:MAG: hypothetical protein IJY70_03050 [Clostridia bacterium]|nr:hypothetical protein [Clostridia bacterium]
MKKKIVSLLSAIALTFGATALTGCGDTPPADPGNPITASVVSASLLDGKIANLLSAQGVGIQEKVPATSPQLNAQAGALYQDQDEPETQKIQEFAKQTESGIVDIHFHAQTAEKKSYNDFNLQYQTHHHGGVACIYKICNLISDEIQAEESTGENTDTVVSLNARVNKLYSTENFTFIAISSAVTGDFTVESQYERVYPQPNLPAMATNANTFVNMEDHVASGSTPFSYSYIEIPANNGRPKGFIPVKKFDTETGYHTANYWSDDYNQSFIIDNETGKTYSLAQFPYIYSVKGGILKIHNRQANGYFDYYKPTKTANGITFTKIELPTASQFPIASRVRGFNIDINGNIVIETGLSTQYFPNLTFDEYGETKVGDIIISCINAQSLSSLQPGGLEYRRLTNAKRYHIADNGKIYRFNFKGNLNNISVNVL